MDWNPLSWPSQIAGSFFGSAASDIATGLETGFDAIIGELWSEFLLPAVEVAVAIFLISVGIMIIVKDDLLRLAPLIASAAA